MELTGNNVSYSYANAILYIGDLVAPIGTNVSRALSFVLMDLPDGQIPVLIKDDRPAWPYVGGVKYRRVEFCTELSIRHMV